MRRSKAEGHVQKVSSYFLPFSAGAHSPDFPQQTPIEWWSAFIDFKYSHTPCSKWILGAKVPLQAWVGLGQPVLSKASIQLHWAHSPAIKIHKNQLQLAMTLLGWRLPGNTKFLSQASWPLSDKANHTQNFHIPCAAFSMWCQPYVTNSTHLLQGQQARLWLLPNAFILPGINFSLKPSWHFCGSETVN